MSFSTRATNPVLYEYRNGDYDFKISVDGTLERSSNSANPKPYHPSSIDIKITDWCGMGCAYCHESSTRAGIHGDLNELLNVLDAANLPPGVELAIGGGDPLAHPDLVPFLELIRDRGLIANLTVNQGHIQKHRPAIVYLSKENLVRGLGISIIGNNKNGVTLNDLRPLHSINPNIVYHLIAGVDPLPGVKPEDLLSILAEGLEAPRFLILGYKSYGRGVQFLDSEVRGSIDRWRKALPNLLGKFKLSFDNLAIDQLKVERCLTREAWQKFYMGDDFTFTMYIDAVKQQYAPTSRSFDRANFADVSLIEFFQGGRKCSE